MKKETKENLATFGMLTVFSALAIAGSLGEADFQKWKKEQLDNLINDEKVSSDISTGTVEAEIYNKLMQKLSASKNKEEYNSNYQLLVNYVSDLKKNRLIAVARYATYCTDEKKVQ